MRRLTKRELCTSLRSAGRSVEEIAAALHTDIETVESWTGGDRLKTGNALLILKNRFGHDPQYQQLLAEERLTALLERQQEEEYPNHVREFWDALSKRTSVSLLPNPDSGKASTPDLL